MTTPLTGLIERMKAVERSLEAITMDVAKDKEDLIITLNQNQLYYLGQDATGKAVNPKYAVRTVQYKVRVGQPADRVTLKDKGDFYQSMFVFFENDRFYIQADDEKVPLLVKKYGNDILGLDKDSLDTLTAVLRAALIEAIKKRLI